MTPEEWAWATEVAGPAERVVLAALVRFRDGDRVTCKVYEIQAVVRASDKWVRAQIDSLVTDGFVARQPRGGRGGMNLRLCFDVLCAVAGNRTEIEGGVRLDENFARLPTTAQIDTTRLTDSVARYPATAHNEEQDAHLASVARSSATAQTTDSVARYPATAQNNAQSITPVPGTSGDESTSPSLSLSYSPPSFPPPTNGTASAKRKKPPQFERKFHDFDDDARKLMHERWDGPLGGPGEVNDQIELALSYQSVEKYTHIPQYVNNWLRKQANERTGPHVNGRPAGNGRSPVHPGLVATRSIKDDDD